MSEIEDIYPMPEPTLQEQLDALTHEIWVVTEQMKVEHLAKEAWKDRAILAEKALRSTQETLGALQRKMGTKVSGRTSDGLHGPAERGDELL